ncbi:MAG: inositol monophosphatase family protein [Paracoccaceae bacterium]
MPENDLSLLIEAAKEAGEIAQSYWQAHPQTWEKPGDQGPVTEADLAVDAMLARELRGARPGYGWLSEESENDPARLSTEHVFIVDPIDGTRAFIAGEDHWSHSLAIARNGAVTAAVVYLPVLGKMYGASLGGGATLNGAPMRASVRGGADGATVLGAKPNFEAARWPGGMPDLRRHFRPSLAYRMALVAEGRFDAMISLRDTWEWDVAAGALLVAEAGAAVSDRHGAPVLFNNPHPALRGMLAGGKEVHREMAARLSPQPGQSA